MHRPRTSANTIGDCILQSSAIVCIQASNMGGTLQLQLDQAIEQWHALAQRKDAYELLQPQSCDREERRRCPSAWREKICEWCYQVIDHW